MRNYLTTELNGGRVSELIHFKPSRDFAIIKWSVDKVVELYYRSYGVHELLVHQAAELSDAYSDAGVEVTLQDGSGKHWQEVKDTAPLSIGIGGTVQAAVQGSDRSWTIVSVNTQHPLFWLVSQPEITRIKELLGKRIAGRPFSSPPGVFGRIIFIKHGVDLTGDCTYIEDRTGFELLRDDRVAASHVSSGALAFELEDEGYRLLAFYGDEFQTSTVGLAVNETQASLDNDEIQRIINAQRSALRQLKEDPELAHQAITQIEPDMAAVHASRLYEEYIRPYWTTDGKPDMEIAENSLRAIATELGVSNPPPVSELYEIPELSGR